MEFSTQLKKKKDKLNPCLRILANRNLDFQTNSISLSSGRHWKRRLSYPLVFDHCCIQWPIKRNFLKNSFHQTYLLRKFKFSFHLFSRTLLHIAYCMASKQEIFFFFFFLQITTLELNESACQRPLVETEHKSSWYEGIEGCGIQCENPIFDTEEHTRIHRFVGAFGSLSFICSLFTMVKLLIITFWCLQWNP